MTDVVEFLRARLDEDDQMARAAAGKLEGGQDWRVVNPDDRYGCHVRDALGDFVTFQGTYPDHVPHIARHDPARVLREIDAKRRIIDECAYWEGRLNADETHSMPCLADRYEVAMSVLWLLALPYADHPDYRQEWRR